MECQITQQEWRQFSDRWARYKTVALETNSYSVSQTTNEFWVCCYKGVQNNLQNLGITVTSMEEETLKKVKDLAVKTVNLLPNICQFFKIAQKEGQGLCQYVAQLKGAAELCDFMVGSGIETVSYVDQMVLGRLVDGLRN